MKAQFKCPWCGTAFENGKELDLHARDHYSKCNADYQTISAHHNVAVVTG